MKRTHNLPYQPLSRGELRAVTLPCWVEVQYIDTPKTEVKLIFGRPYANTFDTGRELVEYDQVIAIWPIEKPKPTAPHKAIPLATR